MSGARSRPSLVRRPVRLRGLFGAMGRGAYFQPPATGNQGMIVKYTLDGLLYMGFKRFKYDDGGYVKVNNNFVCNQCGASFSGEPYMKLHAQEHKAQPRLLCAFCGEPFTLLHKLRGHVRKCPHATSENVQTLLVKLPIEIRERIVTLLDGGDVDPANPYATLLSRKRQPRTRGGKADGPKPGGVYRSRYPGDGARAHQWKHREPANKAKTAEQLMEELRREEQAETEMAVQTLLNIMSSFDDSRPE